MKKLAWLENPQSRQATKLDLIDVANALGAAVYSSDGRGFTVPELRGAIRLRLQNMAQAEQEQRAARRQPSLFESLNEEVSYPGPDESLECGCAAMGGCVCEPEDPNAEVNLTSALLEPVEVEPFSPEQTMRVWEKVAAGRAKGGL